MLSNMPIPLQNKYMVVPTFGELTPKQRMLISQIVDVPMTFFGRNLSLCFFDKVKLSEQTQGMSNENYGLLSIQSPGINAQEFKSILAYLDDFDKTKLASTLSVKIEDITSNDIKFTHLLLVKKQ